MHAYLLSLSLVSSPMITLGIEDMQVPLLTNDIALVCVVTLSGVRAGTDVDVELNWMKDGSSLSESSRVTVSDPQTQSLGVLVSGSVEFMPLEASDSGEYTCEATITPHEGNVPPLTASESTDLTVISESCRPYMTCTHVHTCSSVFWMGHISSLSCSYTHSLSHTHMQTHSSHSGSDD